MLGAMKRLALLVPERANIASLENARQGFLAANGFLRERGCAPRFDVRLVAATPQVRLDHGRITVQADTVLEAVGEVDLCVVPPIQGDPQPALQENGALIDWLAGYYKNGGEVASLCVGAALLAAGGVLDGQRAVVHWAAQSDFGRLFPAVRWVSDRVVLEANGIYTSGGAFSAAHLVLHLVDKYTDRETAIWCAKLFQLDWSRQSQLPFVVFVGQKTHGDGVVRQVQEHIEANYTERLTVEQLAQRVALGRRTLERRFRHATGNSIVEYVQRIRIEAAKKQLESSRKSVAEVMYEVGYNDTKAFRDIFNKYCGMSPLMYKERYL
ncbi:MULTISPECIES: GlxA family transcriptional regulator [Bordetella]|nr:MULTISPECIES: helix-turn-helix domain-containing protein [Bordetella]KAK64810.1 DNA-binding helix-turn-helix protein [Bordetella bronchiseptica 980-2]KCV49508.1 DNA-binding helix-turn-helix protein [Bordetella bronchiseptica 3E44]KCV56222.1 DNA-binding helix-turn-helix protein [Bordetella bronchiseptica 980]KDB83489.1 DNA-binding helix-turn-helix protein [Bordetella bronchiseptica CARE970018BB]KDB85590.1 DNA-binding helix-turn-helix protein [Bordetella bronchiseptica D756]